MNVRRIYPLAMGAFLLIVASFSDSATASALHCNAKFCNGDDNCVEQTGGPPGWSTHCIDNGPTCLWDRCKPH